MNQHPIQTPPKFYMVGSHLQYILALGESGGAAEITEVIRIVIRCLANNTRLPDPWVQGV